MSQVPLEVQLAIGRIMRMLMGGVPFDEAVYWQCRNIVLDASPESTDYSPNWARDRLKGAQGD
jgi:hypothetical protein